MNRRRLLQTAAAALLAPAAARALPAAPAAELAPLPLASSTPVLDALPRLSAARGTIRYASPPALSAAGGLCAPVSPYYPLIELEAGEREAVLRMQA